MLKYICIIFILSLLSCGKKDTPDPQSEGIELREGVSEPVTIGKETLEVTLASVTPIFSEGVGTQDGVFTMHRVYDVFISIGDTDLVFRTDITVRSDQKRTGKSWEVLEKSYQGIKSYGSYQIGVADVYSESGDDGNGAPYIVRILIK